MYYSGCGISTVKTLEKKGIIAVVDKTLERNPYKDLKRSVDSTPIALTSGAEKCL